MYYEVFVLVVYITEFYQMYGRIIGLNGTI